MIPVSTSAAPAAIGPYSQAIAAGGLLFVSGQLPIDPATGEFPSADAVDQMRQCLRNIAAIAEAAGASLSDVVKTTIYVTDLSRFAEINAGYAEAFAAPYPARATVEVAALPKGAAVEVDAILALKGAV
ncbi:RutC family protein y4sK [Cypionkella aquatica]|uniref:RutC family protein y4sK n=1 Tax=Cypionkella aquatica TaxID=1756042 RepID=A0AA37X0Q8_9RHOB|nr:Rid family detoxifying hydrolase [Cypionkella aquatica]GLS87139.1 RutC family protein y4sK [Cypionkella aquatica]